MKPITLMLMLVFSMVVLVVGMPPLEMSRQEARFAQAYIQARQIKLGTLPANTVDPWGSPFTIIRDDRNQIVSVVSAGPDRSIAVNGSDVDGVSAAMAFHPHRKMMRQRQNQWLVVLGLSASPWLISVVVFLRSFLRRLLPSANKIDVRRRIGPTT